MKKKLISLVILSLVIIGSIGIHSQISKHKKPIISQPKMQASYTEINGLKELKSKADTIVEVFGTNNQEVIDYKGIKMIKTNIKILDVLKGDSNLKEIAIVQTDGLECEKPPLPNEKLLMFLRKGIDLTDCYVPIGGNQGIYKIVNNNTNRSNSSNNFNVIKPTSMINKKILRDLQGDYNNIKKRIKYYLVFF